MVGQAPLYHNDCIANRYVVYWKAGQGRAGGAVYAVKDLNDADGPRKALKYPVKDAELEVLKALREAMSNPPNDLPKCKWMPQLLEWGVHHKKPYVVVELLGKSMREILLELKGSLKARWLFLRALGRMLLRGLQALHTCGFVHCDISPGNIVLGRPPDLRPYLVDFGTAVPYPGGVPQRSDRGSLDYNSIRTAEGGVRGPYDDIESLGWVLCSALFGELPWFSYTSRADWSHGARLKDEDRPVVCEHVRAAKASLLDDGIASLERKWAHLADIPSDLLDFLRLCRTNGANAEIAGRPDYIALAALLGGTNTEETEEDLSDLARYQRWASGEEKEPEGPDLPVGEPYPVKVLVTHATHGCQITVEVMSTATILDVRHAVLAAQNESKLSQVKIVKTMGETSFATLPDSEYIRDCREFGTLGMKFKESQASAPSEATPPTPETLTLEQAIAMQNELLKAFSTPEFQEKLAELRQKHSQEIPVFKLYQELVFWGQKGILPKYGFEATRRGATMMVGVIATNFGKDPTITSNYSQIQKVLALDG